MFCQDQQAGGIPVDPVDAAKDIGNSLLVKIPGGAVGQGVAMISLGRVNGHAGRFVNHQDILIFEDDGKGKRSRLDLPGRVLFDDPHGQTVAAS